MALKSNCETALAAGFWAALPLDYMLRITGRTNHGATEAKGMPAGSVDHPLAPALLLRALRLNCLTSAYSGLWAELSDASWEREIWAADWTGLPSLNTVSRTWERGTPLRTERARRAALVEIDALVSVWLGMDVDELIAILRSRYPILAGREEQMWFDAAGRRIAADPYASGFGQAREHCEQLMAHLDDPQRNSVPEGYRAPFYKADRENEYRQAHAVFSKRLQDAIDAGWQPS